MGNPERPKIYIDPSKINKKPSIDITPKTEITKKRKIFIPEPRNEVKVVKREQTNPKSDIQVIARKREPKSLDDSTDRIVVRKRELEVDEGENSIGKILKEARNKMEEWREQIRKSTGDKDELKKIKFEEIRELKQIIVGADDIWYLLSDLKKAKQNNE